MILKLLGLASALLAYTILVVFGDVRLCSKDQVYNCPGGLLLHDPAILAAAHDFKNDRYCASPDICQVDSLACGHRSQYFTGHLLVGNFTVNEELEIFENSEPGVCKSAIIESNILSRKKRTAPGETTIIVQERATADQIDATKKLFYHLANLNPDDTSPTDRLVKLLSNVFRTIDMRCDPTKLDPMFTRLTHKAFLWLFKQAAEGPPGGDIPQEEIQRIATALDECALKTNRPVKVVGIDCMENITYVQLKQEGIDAVYEYIYDDKVFRWGKYDPIIDSVWLAIDTLHGLCEAELAKQGVTHQYETYMLRLLKPPLIETRWRTPTPLFRHEVFDQMLVSPLNESVAILDACCVAGWKSSSYIARNIRPIDMLRRRKKHRVSRKKRMVEGDVEEEITISKQNAYCFQSDEERDARIEQIKSLHC